MRSVCNQCQFILERCLCEKLRPIFNQTGLIILQYPKERKHALNTVKVMEKSFQKIRVFSGEFFEEDQSLMKLIDQHKTALLFPGISSNFLAEDNRPSYDQLILLDGTWKKTKKLYFLNPFLHSLPKLMLKKETPSLYQIRQSQHEFSLSTLEASVAALNIIEPALDCSSAMNAFMQMIDFQIEKMGKDIFEKNYRK